MDTVYYDKLVRDKIPQIIRSTGSTCQVRRLEEGEYLQYLEKKLKEELAEYLQDKTAQELADLLEVIKALAAAQGISWEAMEELRRQKEENRGAFQERILLESVMKEA